MRRAALLAGTCLLTMLLSGCGGPRVTQGQATAQPSAAPEPNGTAPEPREAVIPSEPVACDISREDWSAGQSTHCNATCRAESFNVSRCVPPLRTEHVVRAACECGPAALGSELSGCGFDRISLVPLEQLPRAPDVTSPVDGCTLELACAPGKLSVHCDGEQDGTGTSLCECTLNGQPLRLPRSDAWPGVGAKTCHDAAVLCLNVGSQSRR